MGWTRGAWAGGSWVWISGRRRPQRPAVRSARGAQLAVRGWRGGFSAGVSRTLPSTRPHVGARSSPREPEPARAREPAASKDSQQRAPAADVRRPWTASRPGPRLIDCDCEYSTYAKKTNAHKAWAPPKGVRNNCALGRLPPLPTTTAGSWQDSVCHDGAVVSLVTATVSHLPAGPRLEVLISLTGCAL